MHGTSGQYRLDMKRDTPRTLMLKMDARLTFAGRERNVALQLEGEREKKHIEWHRQLSQTEFKREERNVRKRMEFFQSLIEDNKAKRRTSMKDVNLFETEIEAGRIASNRRWSKTLPPLAVRRKPANLDLAENVGSVRRDQQSYSHNRANERLLNRSLNELSNSYRKHATQKELNDEKLNKIRAEMSTIGRPQPIPEEPTQTPSSRNGIPKLSVSFGEPQPSRSRGPQQLQQFSLPELPSRNQPLIPSGARRTTVSQHMSGTDINRLPGLTAMDDKMSRNGIRRVSMASKNFYIDTSHAKTVGRRRRDSIQLVTLRNPNAKPKPKPRKLMNGLNSMQLPAANLPSHFYEGVYEDNPFLTPDFKPNSTRELVNTTKSDNMYAWLGLESEEELASLRGGDVIGVGKEGTDEMEWLEIESTSDDQSIPDQDTSTTTSGKPPLLTRRSSVSKRIYRIGGEEVAKAKANPLKKFARAAKTIMIVRNLADTVGVIVEETGDQKEQTDKKEQNELKEENDQNEQKEQNLENEQKEQNGQNDQHDQNEHKEQNDQNDQNEHKEHNGQNEQSEESDQKEQIKQNEQEQVVV